MLKNKTIRDILWGLLAYTIVFIVPFAFLTTFEFSDWKYEPFVTAIIGTFMGGGTIAIITAGLLVFQKKLDSEYKRQESILNTRIELYLDIVEQISGHIKDGKITPLEKDNLNAISFKINLLAEVEVQTEYEKLLSEINAGEIDDAHIASKLNDVIDKMNKSIGVFESIDKSRTKKDIRIAKANIKDIKKSRYSGYKSKEDLIESKDHDVSENVKALFDEIHAEILKLEDVNDEEIRWTSTGGLTAKCGKKKFVGLNFHAKGKKLEIMILRDEDKKHIRPASTSTLDFSDIREYSPQKSPSYIVPWGAEFYKLMVSEDTINDEDKKLILSLIKDGHRNVLQDTYLKVKEDEHKRLADIFCKGDEAKASPWNL